ncbi:MAG: DUF6456 domain-containing protein [Alphaproteobacteria bacterium]|nr:DUF6456 domain-containing protein [Alphaproteobacteria bacterium]
MMTPAERQEFIRIARRLTEEGAFLCPHEAGYGLMVKRNKWQKPIMRVAKDKIAAFVRDELITNIKAKHNHFKMTQAGRAHYRRYLNQTDPYRAQHQKIETDEAGISRNMSETPLSWLKARAGKGGGIKFSDAEFKAGEYLRRDYEISRMSKRLCVDWSRPIAGTGSNKSVRQTDLPDMVLDASRRFTKALETVGPDLADILVPICCELVGLETVEKNMQWPRRSAKLVLKFALSRLATYYGLQPPRKVSVSERIRSTIA